MNLTISCPACRRSLRVPENLLGQAVKCPSCSHTFVAPESAEEQPMHSAVPPQPHEYSEKPLPSKRRVLDDGYEDDEDEAPRRPRRRREKPGKVQAIAVMMLVGGILATLYGAGLLAYFGIIGVATFGMGFLLCLWPGPYYGLVTGIMAITKSSRMLGEKDSRPTPPTGMAIMMIINIINCDMVNLVLGILILAFLADDEVKDYYRRG